MLLQQSLQLIAAKTRQARDPEASQFTRCCQSNMRAVSKRRDLFFVRALSGPVLRDTARLSQRYPSIARYGVFGVSTWPIGCDTPSPFSERSPLGEHAKWRCDTTPPKKGVSQRYLRNTHLKQGKWVRYPPLRYYLERVLRDMGAVSRTGPLSESQVSRMVGFTLGANVFQPRRFVAQNDKEIEEFGMLARISLGICGGFL